MHYGVHAHGVTLSRKQFDFGQRLIREQGLEHLVTLELKDYRDLAGEAGFDKIASVGMFEHVGLKNLPLYFRTVHRLLKPDGLFLNHGITHEEDGWGKCLTTQFINRYVFPDGELDRVSNIQGLMEESCFEILHVEALRPSLRAHPASLGEAAGGAQGRSVALHQRKRVPCLAPVHGGLRADFRGRQPGRVPDSCGPQGFAQLAGKDGIDRCVDLVDWIVPPSETRLAIHEEFLMNRKNLIHGVFVAVLVAAFVGAYMHFASRSISPVHAAMVAQPATGTIRRCRACALTAWSTLPISSSATVRPW